MSRPALNSRPPIPILREKSHGGAFEFTQLKLSSARQTGSYALEAEPKETIACSWLSVITLGGLGLNAAPGW